MHAVELHIIYRANELKLVNVFLEVVARKPLFLYFIVAIRTIVPVFLLQNTFFSTSSVVMTAAGN